MRAGDENRIRCRVLHEDPRLAYCTVFRNLGNPSFIDPALSVDDPVRPPSGFSFGRPLGPLVCRPLPLGVHYFRPASIASCSLYRLTVYRETI
jgi:hypothetical protein